MPITKADVELYRAFQKSPILFIEKVWGLVPQPLKPEYQDKIITEYRPEYFEPFEKGKHITWQQCLILRAVEKALHGEALKRISVRSGRGIGKTATLAWLVLWYLFCFKDAQIPCTAPTAPQLHDVLWKEIAVWLDRMPKEISDLYEWQAGYIKIKERPGTWFARAKTARKENPEALAGAHGEYVMLLGDEASGIPNQIFKVAEGSLTDRDFFFILISNPRRLQGYFYDTHHKDKVNWQTLAFNAEESPIVDRQFINRIIEKYGRDSDEYRVEVLGEFPRADAIDEKGYVPLFIEQDLRFIPDVGFVGEKRMGVDPAGEGSNKSSWAVRDEFKAKIVAKEDKSTPKSVAQKTLTLMDFHKVKPKETWLDNFGEGANAAQEIALVNKTEINAVNPGDKPDDEAKFLNKRAEMMWRLKEWARSGGEFVQREGLKEQLLSIKYRRELNGKIKIMSKREMQKEGIPSPDDVDAIGLTFYKKREPKRKPYKQPPYQPVFGSEGAKR